MSQHSVRAHAKYSCSGASRWMACPGSVKLSEGLPKPPDSPYAEEGTRAHECLEKLLAHKGAGITQLITKLKKKYPMEMVDHVQDTYFKLLDMANADGLESGDLLVEQRVSLEFLAPEMFGTVDTGITQPFGRLTVADFKYGAGVAVDPEENKQLLLYALGLAHQSDYNFSEVRLVILQPRAFHKDGPLREWTCSMDELLAWRDKFSAAIAECEAPNPKLCPGDHCRWCTAKSVCPELSTKAFKDAQLDFAAVTAPESVGTEVVTMKPASELAPEDLGRILTASVKIKKWLAEVEAKAYAACERGAHVPGWKLVAKKALRSWTDVEKSTNEAWKEFGEDAFSKPELLSPAQLEKVKKVGKAWVEARVSKVSSGNTLVPETDPRPALDQISRDFETVEALE